MIANDDLHRICHDRLHLPTIDFSHLNQLLAKILCALFMEVDGLMPTVMKKSTQASSPPSLLDSLRKRSTRGIDPPRFIPLYEIISRLCFHPDHKILSVKFTPQVGQPP